MPVDFEQFRNLMAGVCAPVTVVTTLKDAVPYGTTVSAFASLSLDPPMVSVALHRRSGLLAQILQTRCFGINVLGKSQERIAQVFASREADRFALVQWAIDRGMPRLASVASFMLCSLASAVEGGDHILLLGIVEEAERTDAPPLIYGERTFGTHSVLQERDAARARKQWSLLMGEMP